MSTSETLTAPMSAWRGYLRYVSRASVRTGLVSGSVIMFSGSVLVSVLNFAYNMVTGHLLGPEQFGHASLAVTLLMLASALTLSFQLVCAKFVARSESREERLHVIAGLRRRAWMLSASIALVVALFCAPITAYLQLPSRAVILLLDIGFLFYIPLGVERGVLQGLCNFRGLVTNLLVETTVKLLAAALFVELLLSRGLEIAMLGAIAALTASVAGAYIHAPLRHRISLFHHFSSQPAWQLPSFREGMQASVFFAGQVLITNVDIVLVKHFFNPHDAGLYAAIASVGRVLYFACWSITGAMFPISAAAKGEQESKSFIVVPLLLVMLLSGTFVLITYFFPHLIVGILYGPSFHNPAERLLSPYAVATGIYAMSVVVMTFEISRKIANTAWLQLAFSGAVIAAICLWHGSLPQVVYVQILLRAVLLTAVFLPFLWMSRSRALPLREAA
jgi:O-antigen/teichoic acid export membrane protein